MEVVGQLIPAGSKAGREVHRPTYQKKGGSSQTKVDVKPPFFEVSRTTRVYICIFYIYIYHISVEPKLHVDFSLDAASRSTQR